MITYDTKTAKKRKEIIHTTSSVTCENTLHFYCMSQNGFWQSALTNKRQFFNNQITGIRRQKEMQVSS